MPHNQRIRPPGMWTPNSALLAAEVERLDQAQYLEIHEGGGTWAIQSNVVVGAVGNASWTFTAPVVVNDISGHVVSGKTLTVDPGATLDLWGTQKIEPGAALHVLGAAQNPGIIWVEQLGKLIITTNGYFGIYGAGTGDVFGTLNIQDLGTVAVQAGGAIKVQAGGLVQLQGTAQQTAKIVLADSSELDVGDGASIQVVGGSIVLTSQGASWVKLTSNAGVATVLSGQTFVSDLGADGSNGTLYVGSILGNGVGHLQVGTGGDLTVALGGVTNFNNQGVLKLNAGCTVNFDGSANLKGSPVFLDSLLLAQTAKATFYTGSTFADGSVRTYTAPQIPWGPYAVDGVATPIFGPIPPQGQTFVDFDPSGLTLVNTPQNLPHEIGWTLTVPSHSEVARFLYIRQLDQTKQGNLVGVWFQNSRILQFFASNSAATTSAALLFWDTNVWTLVFVVGVNVAQG